ncbi:5-(carboxyamino)imidazole ribonucleotide mutase [Methanobacterium sp. CWC-01]|uniref:5-(carboxyamino)imidazole ribonucleotide mutase n=1 Tax=Methanobacterium aridiramus TaxID=2584467 RepID=UPI002576B533|nr:5-(carboxyamino)imidazole ribonucleotide mutase [Methanobacterium sp. CWC-01]WJI09574.1 5-(carboxyamino)imidazole ribonucleotide mutase [Methanobacterium sp. CWC-01]
MEPKVMILLGSASDINIAEKALDALEKLEIPYDIRVASAHRTHQKVKHIVSKATEKGIEVFMGIAGLSAHLPGIIAANTYKPVIGVPVDVKLGGLDALFATVQMPLGAPVATVGVDRGENAAILAAQIIGIHDFNVRERLSSMRKDFFTKVKEDEDKLLDSLRGKYYSPPSWKSEMKDNPDETSTSPNLNPPKVAVVSGSYSDMKVAKKTTMFLDKLNISHESAVVSPIRSPDKFEKFLDINRDAEVFIAISGLSAHVTGAVVAHTEKPVLGVPCSMRLDGLDALLSMVNMPPGVPVATTGIDAGGNAAILAAEMLALGDNLIKEELLNFKGHINCKW